MNREELIYKWLNHELDAREFNAFKQHEDYEDLMRLNHSLQDFNSPEYHTSEELQSILNRIHSKKTSTKNWFPIAASVAAIVVLCFSFYYYTTTLDSTFKTLAAQKQIIELPDGSTAHLNAASELSFNTHNWKEHREIQLEGEAYFKVAKGSKFEVKTTLGTVSVLGTQFNINQRDDFFEVICYEGLVNVSSNSYNVNLQPGNEFLIRDGKLIATEQENHSSPSWIDNYSRFKSVPYKNVIAEFERQYNLEVDLDVIDDSQLFTGSFVHDDMETALKSITLPLQLTYSKENRTIILKRE